MDKSICETIKYSELIYSSHLFGSKQVNTVFKTRQSMYLQSNTEAPSSIHCCLQSSNLLHTVHTACQPTLQLHNSHKRTEKDGQWKRSLTSWRWA